MDYTKIILPELRLMFHVKHQTQLAAAEANVSRETLMPSPVPELLVVAGGRAPQPDWLCSAAKGRSVYAADRGAACCLNAGVVPRALYGDCDSTTEDVYERLAALGTQVQRFLPEKDDTDLQLLLKSLPSGSLLATGIWGGRFDHLFSNVYTLLGVKQQRGGVVLLADEQELLLLLEAGEDVELELHAEVEAVSLLPLSAETCVDFSGVHWPLKNAALNQRYPYAISNVPSGKDARLHCSCHAGAVGLYIRWQDERISMNN